MICHGYAYHQHAAFTLNNWLFDFKGAVSRYSVIFCAFLGEQKLATARANVTDINSVSHANSFIAQAESSKFRFPWAIVIFRGLALWPPLFFPTQNGCPQITDYRDTAALIKVSFLKVHANPHSPNQYHKTSLAQKLASGVRATIDQYHTTSLAQKLTSGIRATIDPWCSGMVSFLGSACKQHHCDVLPVTSRRIGLCHNRNNMEKKSQKGWMPSALNIAVFIS